MCPKRGQITPNMHFGKLYSLHMQQQICVFWSKTLRSYASTVLRSKFCLSICTSDCLCPYVTCVLFDKMKKKLYIQPTLRYHLSQYMKGQYAYTFLIPTMVGAKTIFLQFWPKLIQPFKNAEFSRFAIVRIVHLRWELQKDVTL